MADNSSGSGGVVNIELKDIRITDRLDCGGFGVVKKGFYNGMTVAVKFLAPENRGMTKRDKRYFQKEARRLNEASHHESMLNIHGVVLDENTFALVLEYMHFGNVEDFIKDFYVRVPLRMRIIKQIISAMDYLHSHNPPIKHLDLKAANVLIDCRFIAKVGDFGLSEFETITVTAELPGQNVKRRATLTHVAPEVLIDIRIKSTTAEDVYGFAITAWQIFTGEEVYKGKDVDTIIQCVKRQRRPDLNCLVQGCPDYVRNLIKICWDHQPGRRPTFRSIKYQFDKVYVRYDPQIRTSCLDIRRQICEKHACYPEDYREEFECTEFWDRPSGVEMLRDTEPDTTPTVQPQEDRPRLESEHRLQGEPIVQTQHSSSSDSSQATPDGNTERYNLTNVAGPESQQSGLHCISYGSQNTSTNLATPNLSWYVASNDQTSNSHNVTPAVTPQVNDVIALAYYTQRSYVREMTEGESGQTVMNHHSQDGGNPNIDILVDRRTNTQKASSAYVEPQARVDRQIPEARRGGNQGNPPEATWVGNNPNNQEENDRTMMKMSQMSDRVSVLPPEQLNDPRLVTENRIQPIRMPVVQRLFHDVLPYEKKPRGGLSPTLPLDLDLHRCNIRPIRMPVVQRLFHDVLPYEKKPRGGLSPTLPLDLHRCNISPTIRKPVLETDDNWKIQSNWETESSFSCSTVSSPSKHNIVRLSNFKKPCESCITADMVQSIACIAESVGALIYKDSLIGTVFRVGSEYAMTAQHVFDKVKDPSNLKHAFVVFTNRIIGRSKFRQEFEIYSDQVSLQALDTAVFRLKGDSSKLPPPLQLSQEIPTCGKKVCLIGYGNAETENVKSVDSNCSIISPNSPRVTDVKSWMESNRDSLKHDYRLRNIDSNIINQSYSGIEDNNRLLLDTSMIFGASGSPIIEIQNDTESTAKVVGVFTHGLPEFVYLLPVMERNNIPKELLIEVGTKSSAIFTELMKLEMHAVLNELFFKKTEEGITDMVIP